MLTGQTLTVATVGFSPGFAYLDSGYPRCWATCRRPPPVPAPRFPPARSPSPTATPPCILTAARGDGSSSGARTSGSSTPRPSPTPGWPSATGCASSAAPHAAWVDGRSAPAPPPHPVSPVLTAPFPGHPGGLRGGGRRVPDGVAGRGAAQRGGPRCTGGGPRRPLLLPLANRLVGNAPEAAPRGDGAGPNPPLPERTFVAAVGASPDLRLQGQPMAAGRVVPVAAGQRLVVGPIRGGSPLLCGGGRRLGRPRAARKLRHRWLLCLGPGPIVPGSDCGPASRRRRWGITWPARPDGPRAGRSSCVWCPARTSRRSPPGRWRRSEPCGSRWRTRATGWGSGSSGTRGADGGPGTGRARRARLAGHGARCGAAPPDGDPVILLGDRATLGGYPVIAVVATVDHGRLGQVRPGTVVLVPIAGTRPPRPCAANVAPWTRRWSAVIPSS